MSTLLAAARHAGVPRANLIVAASALAIAGAISVLMLDGRLWPGDTINYLAAGERLNAGHDLYGLSPGDRPVPLTPPYWTVPLVSPPLVAVIWRPLALLGEGSVQLWWLATIVSLLVVVWLTMQAPGSRGPVALYLMSVPLGVEAAQGNLNAFLQLATFGVWWIWWRGRADVAGVLVGVMAVAKLTPAALAVWLLVISGRRALVGLAVGVVTAVAVGVAGAGWDAHVAYLDVIRSAVAVGTTDYSLGGLARTLGVPGDAAGLVPIAIVAAGLVAIVALRGRPPAAFRVAVLLLVAGSPVVYANTPVFLLAALAPSIWQVRAANLMAAEGSPPAGPIDG